MLRFHFRRMVMAGLVLCFGATAAMGAIKTKTIEYKVEGETMEGYLAWDDAQTGNRPGVLVLHEWKGLVDFTRDRAEALAKLGYLAFAADLYGKGIRPATNDEAKVQAGKMRGDRVLLRKRVNAGLELLRKHAGVDGKRLAAVGYCFGGMSALELARSGGDVQGIVVLHGSYDTAAPEDMKNFKGKALVIQGSLDQASPPEKVAALEKEFSDAGVDWQLVMYGGAAHAFTNPSAGNDPSKGAAYDAKATARSWEAMQVFFGELFGK